MSIAILKRIQQLMYSPFQMNSSSVIKGITVKYCLQHQKLKYFIHWKKYWIH